MCPRKFGTKKGGGDLFLFLMQTSNFYCWSSSSSQQLHVTSIFKWATFDISSILTWLQGFRVKIVSLLRFFWLLIPKADEYKENNTKSEVCAESLGAMLEYWYIERGPFTSSSFIPH